MLKHILIPVAIIFMLNHSHTIDGSIINQSNPPHFPFIHASDVKNWEFLDDDGKVLLAWTVDPESETITFELEAETHGYVGFGISPSGSMTGADIFIAGAYDNGTSYHSDNYATGFLQPIIDDHDDWTLHEAREFSGLLYNRTYLKFSRLINTCDGQDYPIGVDTNRLIWALGASDTVEYHTPARRGTKSVLLLGAGIPDLDLGQMSEWKLTLDMEMPEKDTSYWCSFHKGPKLEDKHHIVSFDAFVPDADAIAHTHHFILYNCYNPIDDSPLEKYLGNYTVDKGYKGDHCYKPWDPENADDPKTWLTIFCPEYLYVWAKGGKKMVFPEKVGYPIGYGDQKGVESFYMLEIHYDNPEKKQAVTFETGVKFYYTNMTRDHDAGLLAIGTDVSPTITIPPNTTDFITVGHCGPQCTSEKFPEDGIKIFNSLLHSHLSGRKLKLRQFRRNQELVWPDFDDHYDFDYQQNKPLNEEVIFLPGDQMTYECTYESMWKKGRVVIGDLSTSDEMCQAFLWYYPKLEDLDVCASSYDFDQGLLDLGITNFTRIETVGNPKVWINEPLSLEGDYEESLSTKFNWTEEIKLELEEKRRFSKHEGLCFARKDNPETRPVFQIGYPEITRPYTPEDVCETTTSTTISTTRDPNYSGSGVIMPFSPILFLIVFCIYYSII